MTQEFSNENRGAIWKNNKKETEKHPDFTGELNVDGVSYWVSAWKRKEGASDKAPALSFQIKLKEATQKQAAKPAAKKDGPFEDFDSNIPF